MKVGPERERVRECSGTKRTKGSTKLSPLEAIIFLTRFSDCAILSLAVINMKCNRCNLPIDSTKEAHVVMPNPEQCGFRSRRPTAFAHASCFERDVKDAYRRQLESEAELAREIAEARAGR